MKIKIILNLLLAITLGVIAIELLPDPKYSAQIKSITGFEYKLKSSGGMGEGLQISSLDYGIVMVRPLSSNEWMLYPKTMESSLEINGRDRYDLLSQTEEEWKKPFLVRANPDKNFAPEEIGELPHGLSPEVSRFLSNRRKNLARLIILPHFSPQSFKTSCYLGNCEVSFKKDSPDLYNLKMITQNNIQLESTYIIELDEEGILSTSFNEKMLVGRNNPLGLSLFSQGELSRKNITENLIEIDLSRFSKISSISIEEPSPVEVKIQLSKEMKDVKIRDVIELGKFVSQTDKNKMGEVHLKLKKLLTVKPQMVEELVQELKTLSTKNSFYITSVGAMQVVDSEETQKGMRNLYKASLEKEDIFEARNLILGLGSSKKPTQETVDLIMETAYSDFGQMNEKLSESAQLASGTLAKSIGESSLASFILERPLQMIEDALTSKVSEKNLILALEVLGNSGHSPAFELVERLSKNSLSLDIELSLINSLRFMKGKRVESLLHKYSKHDNTLIQKRAAVAISIRSQLPH
jgi:hypothetical protein